jgi:hypothetical protein
MLTMLKAYDIIIYYTIVLRGTPEIEILCPAKAGRRIPPERRIRLAGGKFDHTIYVSAEQARPRLNGGHFIP